MIRPYVLVIFFFGGMKMKKERIIFDLDGTLLTSNPSLEREYFQSIYNDRASILLDQLGDLLDTYENFFPKYDVDLLAHYLSEKTGLNISPKVVSEWIHIIAYVPDTMEEGVMDTLEHLKSHNKSLAVLTNWFSITQHTRLKRAGLYDFFDQIYTGEQFLKPLKKSYYTAIGIYHPDDCLFVGDSVNRDYIGPRACGMESILYDKNDIEHQSIKKIKRMNELKNIL